MGLQDLINKQRAELAEDKTAETEIVLGGEIVVVKVTKLMPDDWQQLVAVHPPRTAATGDANVGYDQATLPRDYPAHKLEVGGETVDTKTWQELWAVLETAHRNKVGTLMWGLNFYAALQELRDLGKAAAGQPSSSPARSGSRPAASKGGSQRRSRATTTKKAG